MARSKKRSATDAANDLPANKSPAEPPAPIGQRLAPFGLAAGAGVLAFLGFAGFDVWPLAFVAFVPLFFALDRAREGRAKRAVLLGLLFGFVGHWGGYYWLVQMLMNFSGFAAPLCILFASLLVLYTAGGFTLFAWTWARATERGVNPTLAAVCAFLAAEFVYPLLFPFYYGASFHQVPLLLQTADLGGPLMQSALAISVNAALFEIVRSRLDKKPIPRAGPLGAAAFVLFTLGYGAYRMHTVDADVARAPKIEVGVVQVNMGLLDKRENPIEGLHRHIEQSMELEASAHPPDLIVWPESAYTFFLPEDIVNVRRAVLGPVHTPVLFGGLQERRVDGVDRAYNTAFITDENGDLRGSYDKTYLLAFGEYLPGGEWFPKLYEWSPHSGHFTRGDHVRALPFRNYRITTLICYEDILPAFVRTAVAEGHPHLLANVTNDAWFGDTHEPWIHLALAKFRAVEHHLYLVRSTNSGVSAIVDPTGRVVQNTQAFQRQNLDAQVAMLQESTLFELLGEWPGWLALAAIVWMAFIKRRRAASQPSAS